MTDTIDTTDLAIATGRGDDLAPIRVAVSRVDELSCTSDDILTMLNAVKAAKELLREIEVEAKAKAFAFIEAKGPIVSGTKVWKVGFDTETWTEQDEAVLSHALTLGDLASVSTLLSANAWKPGACRKAFGPVVFAKLFKSETKKKLKDGSPAGPKLLEIDTAFIGR